MQARGHGTTGGRLRLHETRRTLSRNEGLTVRTVKEPRLNDLNKDGGLPATPLRQIGSRVDLYDRSVRPHGALRRSDSVRSGFSVKGVGTRPVGLGAEARSIITTEIAESVTNTSNGVHPASIDLTQTANLLSRLNEMEQKKTHLEQERDLLFFRIQENEEYYEKMLKKLQAQAEEYQEKQVLHQERLERVGKVEDAIIQLYMEMRDRTTETRETAEREKAKELARLKATNPVAVLDSLRANLVILLNFKEDFENELKDQIHRRRTEQERRIEELEEEVTRLRTTAENAKRDMEEATTKRDEVFAERSSLVADFEEKLSDKEKEIVAIRAIVDEQNKTVSALECQVEERGNTIAQLQQRMASIGELEGEIESLKKRHEIEMHHNKVNYAKEVSVVQKELDNALKDLNKARKDADRLQEDIMRAEGYKYDMNRVKSADLKKQHERVKKTVEHQGMRMRELEEELRVSRFIAEDREKEACAARTLVNQLKRQQRHPRRDAEVTVTADSNRQLVEFYRTKLRQKEAEVNTLNNKLREGALREYRQNLRAGSASKPRSTPPTSLNVSRRPSTAAPRF